MIGYERVTGIRNGFTSWYVTRSTKDYEIPLETAVNNGLYILESDYVWVHEIDRNTLKSPILKYSDKKIHLKEAFDNGSLYFGPHYNDVLKARQDAINHTKWVAQEKRRKEENAVAEAENKVREKNRQLKYIADQNEKKQREADFAARMSGTGDYADPTRSAPAPASASASAPASAPAAPADDDGGYASAKSIHPGLSQSFYEHMTNGGKRNKSRKPKRRNSRSKRRNSRSKRRKTLNKSRH